jgi:uncharacterized protein YdhG (YjbR/CyaY superfamily)
MAQTMFKSVDDYLRSQPENVQRTLRQVRSTIRKAMPGAEETISYGIPAFKLSGRTVLYLAGWKEHYSLYPASRAMEVAFKKQLAPYGLSGKGTIRFPFSERVPVGLIAALVKFRLKEAAERARTSTAAGKTARRPTRTASSRRARRR